MNFYDGRRITTYRHTGGRRNTLAALILCFGYISYALLILNNTEAEFGYHQYYSSTSYPLSNDKYDSKTTLEERSSVQDDNEEINEINNPSLDSLNAVNIVPSHIEMCGHLMPRLEHALSKHKVEMKAETLGLKIEGLELSSIPGLHVNKPASFNMEYILVEEKQSICTSQDTPTDSLKRIFSSTLLSIVANKFGLNVDYRHNCHLGKKRNEGEIIHTNSTIQEMLPVDLLAEEFLVDEISFDVLAIKNMCRDCINSFENESKASSDNCVLFARPTSLKAKQATKMDKSQIQAQNSESHIFHGLPTGIETMLPLMRAVFLQIANNWKDQHATQMLDDFRLQFHPSVYQVSNDQADGTKASPDQESVENELTTTASKGEILIYITCLDEDCNKLKDSIALPFGFYREKFTSIGEFSSIIVLVSHSCATQVDGCLSYGQALFSLFVQHFTEVQVELIQTDNTYHIYSQIFLADHLICPPSNACFLPAILSNGQSMLATSGHHLNFVSLFTSDLIYDTNLRLFSDDEGKSVKALDNAFLAGAK